MEQIDAFLAYLESEQRASHNTTEAYGRDLRQFSVWLTSRPGACGKSSLSKGEDTAGNSDNEAADNKSLETVELNDVRDWIGELADSGMTAVTLRRKAQSLRAFFHWGMKRGIFHHNPAANLILAKRPRRLPDFVKESEMESLLDHQFPEGPEEDPEAARSRMVLTLLYSLGLRQDELRRLTDADINTGLLQMRVRGKRDKERIVPVPPALMREISAWQSLRDCHYTGLPAPCPLIPGRDGAISKSTLYRIVREGLDSVSARRKSPHTLRHTFATAMINNGAYLDAVRELLGHASLQTTQIYTHVSFRELLANYRKGHPRMRHDKEEN